MNLCPVLSFPLLLSSAVQLHSVGWRACMHLLKHKHISFPAFVGDVFFIQSPPGQQAQSPWGWQYYIRGKYNLAVNCLVLWHCWVPLFPPCSHVLGVPSFKRNGVWKCRRYGNAGDAGGAAGIFLNQPPGRCIHWSSYGPGAECAACWPWVFPVILCAPSKLNVPLSLFPLL